jgi:hypothetical protein
LQWYDTLPGDTVSIPSIPHGIGASDLVRRLNRCADIAKEERAIDHLAALLLNQPPALEPSEHTVYQTLAKTLSCLMSENLTTSGSRPLRMKAQRLLYYIQMVLSLSEKNNTHSLPSTNIEEHTLNLEKPWDFLPTDQGAWSVSCDRDVNIHHYQPNHVTPHQSLRNGLPTQINKFSENGICFGSIYSNGASLLHNGSWEQLTHEHPILLYFHYEGTGYFLDHFSNLYEATPRRKTQQFALTQVHFARFYGDTLYLMNNGDFSHISSYNMKTGDFLRINTAPVMVCNDMVETENRFYLIDKQQGSIFAFNKQWEYLTKRLSFGRGYGQLLDPVSIQLYKDRLYTVSWLSGKLTILSPF